MKNKLEKKPSELKSNWMENHLSQEIPFHFVFYSHWLLDNMKISYLKDSAFNYIFHYPFYST